MQGSLTSGPAHKRVGGNWSGSRDLNPGPLRPERSALPDCATPRRRRLRWGRLSTHYSIREYSIRKLPCWRLPENFSHNLSFAPPLAAAYANAALPKRRLTARNARRARRLLRRASASSSRSSAASSSQLPSAAPPPPPPVEAGDPPSPAPLMSPGPPSPTPLASPGPLGEEPPDAAPSGGARRPCRKGVGVGCTLALHVPGGPATGVAVESADGGDRRPGPSRDGGGGLI